MTQLRRCSPEIERELHDKEARIRELEAAMGEIDAIACEFASCDDHQTWRAMKDIHEIIRDAPVHTAPPDSEPAEEAGGDDVCMCGLTYSEHTPDDDHSFTPMREHYDAEQQDAMLERRDALAEALMNAIGCLEYYGDRENWTPEVYRYPQHGSTPNWQDCYSYGWQGSGSTAPWDMPADAARKLRELLNAPAGEDPVWGDLPAIRQALSEPAVPEAARTLPTRWRIMADRETEGANRTGIEWKRQRADVYAIAADELDRAIAEQGEQSRIPVGLARLVSEWLADFPEGGDLDGFDQQAMMERAGIIEATEITEIPCGDSCSCDEYGADVGDTCYRVTALGDECRRIAAAPQPEHGESDEL